MTTFHDSLKPLVERAAVSVASKWPSYVSSEDVAQEIWLWAFTKQNSIEKAMQTEGWEGRIYSTMLKTASAAASAEDQEVSGYSKDDTYVYSVAVLETLLESAFTYEDWQSFGSFGDGQPHAKGQVNETGDILAMLSDVKAGLAELKEQYREVLFYKYALPGTGEQKADHLGITQSTFSHRSVRALNALRDQLGRVNPSDLRSGWENRREAVGNEHSQIQTERTYEG